MQLGNIRINDAAITLASSSACNIDLAATPGRREITT